MDIVGYEIDIYLVIVALAGIVVLSIMLLIGNSLKGKKPSSIKLKEERKKRDARTKLAEISPDKNENKSQQPGKLLPGSQNKLPVEPQMTSIANRIEAAKESPGFLSKEITGTERSAPAGTDAEKKVTANTGEVKSAPAGTDAEKSTAPVARLWDKEATQGAKEEPKEETEEKEKGGGLLDVFDEEDVVDTGLAELAGLLVDIDVDTLRKLSSEVSEVLTKRETGSQRRR